MVNLHFLRLLVLLIAVSIGAQVVGLTQTGQQTGDAAASILGVWSVAEVTTTGPNGVQKMNTQPGLRMYTRRHYSVTAVLDKKSPDPSELRPERSAPTRSKATRSPIDRLPH
jgi:hypothetical protein